MQHKKEIMLNNTKKNISIILGFLDGLRPVPKITVSEWADQNRWLSPEAASEPGRWRTNRTPYLKKIMDCLTVYSSYKYVVVMKGAQLGFTEAGNNWIGYIIDNSPAPTLMVQPTDDTVKRNSKMRIEPMIQACESLRRKVSTAKSRSGENTITQKNFPMGVLLMAGANSPVGLRSIPIQNVFLDEVDGYPTDLNGEGSPIELAEARTRTFAKKKIFIISTPTIEGHSAIESAFEETDQHYYHVPCPYCGTKQILKFENLQWEEGKPETARMACVECGTLIEEINKPDMLANGEWIATVPENTTKERIGFHLNSFYSPLGWFSWKDIAAKYEQAKKNPEKMVVVINTIFGETLKESGEAPNWENIYNRRENYAPNTVNADVCFMTAGVDVQKDRIELEIVGWCSDKSSYSIDYRSLLGSPFLTEVWKELAKVLNETWICEDGRELQLVRVAVDSGYATSEVYDFVRSFGNKRIMATKGQDKMQIAFSTPKQIDYNKNGKKIGKLKQWNIGVSFLKTQLYEWFKIEPNYEDGTYPPCYCHFPQYDNRYFEGLTGEDWIEKKKKWSKRYARNEPLDCRVYARAAAAIVGLDRLKPEQLRALGGVTERKQRNNSPDTSNNETEQDPEEKKKRRKGGFWN